MKPISIQAKRAYFLNYVGAQYERTLAYISGTPQLTLGPYKLSGNDAETADWFATGLYAETKSAVDTLLLRDINTMTEPELITLARVYERNVRGGVTRANTTEFIRAGKELVKIIGQNDTNFLTLQNIRFACMYLQSIGVALPTIDLTTMLVHSVDDLVANKVIRIITVEQPDLKFNTFCFIGNPVNREAISMGIVTAKTATEAADKVFADYQQHVTDYNPYADKYRDRNNWRAWQ